MSLYAKAWWFMAWTMLVLLTSGLWFFMPFVRWGIVGAIPGAIFWLAHGAASLWLFRCPTCGTSPFVNQRALFAVAHPWPNRRCSKCGRNLRLA